MRSHSQISFSASRYIANFDREAQELGITLTVSTDFEEFINCCEATPERLPPKPLFDPSESDLTPDNSFWIKGVTSCGEIAHMQAFKLTDLQSGTITQHLSASRKLYYDESLGIDLNKSNFVVNSQTEQVTGRVCYHGELWLKPGKNGFRKKGLSIKLPRMGIMLAFATWNPDYIYSLPSIAVSLNGLISQYGYHHLLPDGIQWGLKKSDDKIYKYLAWSSHSELSEMLQHP